MQILTHDDLASICNKHLVDAIYLYRDDQKASFPTFYVMYSKNRLRSILKKEYNVRSCSNTNTLSLDYEFEDGSTMYDMMPQSNVLYDPQYYTRYNMLLERVSDIVGNLNPEEITYLNQWIDGIKYRDGADRMQVPLRHYEHKMVKLKRRIHESIERD